MGTDEEREDGAEEAPSSGGDAPPKKKARKTKRPAKKRPAKKRPAKKRPAKKDPGVEGPGNEKPRKQEPGKSDEAKRRIPWLWLILAVAAVELFLFGSRGRIEVCVAKEGVHDFALLGTPRTDENTQRFPSCETRLNVGMKSRYDDAKTDAMLNACRRANIFRGKQAILTCAIESDGWHHRVRTEFVMPWEREYQERLFWFLP